MISGTWKIHMHSLQSASGDTFNQDLTWAGSFIPRVQAGLPLVSFANKGPLRPWGDGGVPRWRLSASPCRLRISPGRGSQLPDWSRHLHSCLP